MGTTAFTLLDSTPPSINPKLKGEPLPLLAHPHTMQSPVLFAYSACRDGVYRVIVVHRRGVDVFDPLSGSLLDCSFAVKDRCYIMKAGRCHETSREDVLILADASGSFYLREAYSLAELEEFGSAEHKYISAFICPLPDLIFAGFLAGDVRVFEFGNSTPKFRISASERGAAVRCLAYSKHHKLLLVGFDNSFESQEGTFVIVAHNSVLVYSMSALATQGRTQPVKALEGLENASCTALELVESLNLAIAASSVSGEMHFWDFITGTRLLKVNPSATISSTALLTTLSIVLVDRAYSIMVVGFNDGSVLTSELSFNSASRSFAWQPTKLIKPKSCSIESNLGTTFIEHDPDLDILMIGTDISQLRLLNNFKAQHKAPSEPIQPKEPDISTEEVKSVSNQSKLVSEESLQRVRDRVEGKRKTKSEKLTGFNRFLAEKKPVLLEENPELSMKEIVMQVSAIWGELNEEERLSFND